MIDCIKRLCYVNENSYSVFIFFSIEELILSIKSTRAIAVDIFFSKTILVLG